MFLQQPGGSITTVLPLPALPAGVAGFQRKVSLEVRQAAGDGRVRPVVGVPDLKLPWTGGQIDLGASPGSTQRVVLPVRAVQEGDMVRLVVGN